MIPEIMEIITKCLSKERDHARDVVEALIDSENNYLFTNDRDYKENRSDIVQPSQQDMAGGQGQQPGQPGGRQGEFNDPQQQ